MGKISKSILYVLLSVLVIFAGGFIVRSNIKLTDKELTLVGIAYARTYDKGVYPECEVQLSGREKKLIYGDDKDSIVYLEQFLKTVNYEVSDMYDSDVTPNRLKYTEDEVPYLDKALTDSGSFNFYDEKNGLLYSITADEEKKTDLMTIRTAQRNQYTGNYDMCFERLDGSQLNMTIKVNWLGRIKEIETTSKL